MNLIEITDENKYEIVSKLREYKHKIVDLSPTEFDIVLPLLKGYILKHKQLKEEFEAQIKIYQDILKSKEYFEWKENFNNLFYLRNKCNTGNKLKDEIIATTNWVAVNAFEGCVVLNEHSTASREINDGNYIIHSFFSGFRENSKLESSTLNFKLTIPHFNSQECILPEKIFRSMDFYFMEQEEIMSFKSKSINYFKKATFNVLSSLENIALNNAKEAQAFQEKMKTMKISSFAPQEQKVLTLIERKQVNGETLLLLDDIINIANIKSRSKKDKSNKQKKRAQDIISAIRQKTTLNLSEYDEIKEGYNIL